MLRTCIACVTHCAALVVKHAMQVYLFGRCLPSESDGDPKPRSLFGLKTTEASVRVDCDLNLRRFLWTRKEASLPSWRIDDGVHGHIFETLTGIIPAGSLVRLHALCSHHRRQKGMTG